MTRNEARLARQREERGREGTVQHAIAARPKRVRRWKRDRDAQRLMTAGLAALGIDLSRITPKREA